MRRILFTLAVLGLPFAATNAAPSTNVALQSQQSLAHADKKKFSWEGSCEVKCSDGSCRVVCGSGVVYGNSEFEARLQAEASLRSQAGSQGVVKEGSIKLTIRGGF